MPIKWNISAKAMKARGIMDQISAEYDGLINDGSEHLGDVKGLRSQVSDMKDDLYAAANVMGNSSNGSAEPHSDAVHHQPEAQKNASAIAPSPPEVGQNNTHFPSQS